MSLELSLWHLDPLRASAFVPLPKWIKNKRAVTNIVGTGNDCFKWEVLAGLHPATVQPHRMENYLPYIDLYDFSSLSFPVPLSAVTPFAIKNGILINVYAVEDGKRVIFPLCVTDALLEGKRVDLLMHEVNEIQHYSTICNFSRLISGQLGNHQHGIYCCKICLHVCSCDDVLKRHTERCKHVQLSKFPKDPNCRFTKIQKQLQAPFVVYADFESVLKPLSNIDTTQCVEEEGEPSIVPYQEPIACSFSYKIVSSVIPDFSTPIVWYRGEDAADEFIRVLQREAEELCFEFIESPHEMEFTEENEVHFECAQVCHICQQILVDDNDRVRDRCHFTGVYRGVAHNAYNLNYCINRKSWKLSVIMHTLKEYDGHPNVTSLKSEFGKVRVIPQNLEKHLSISVGRLKFLDSFQFTPQSLDAFLKNLPMTNLHT